MMRREFAAGLALGSILGMIGLLRILLWPTRAALYGKHYVLVAITVACSLVGVVLWGTISGSMLPLIMRRLGFDPPALRPHLSPRWSCDWPGHLLYNGECHSARHLLIQGYALCHAWEQFLMALCSTAWAGYWSTANTS